MNDTGNMENAGNRGDAGARDAKGDWEAGHAGTVSVERRFHGTVVLVILHLRRVAHSNDLEAGLAAARELKMIGPEHERFIRMCLALDEQLQAGEAPADSITPDAVRDLQACALRLNSADPA